MMTAPGPGAKVNLYRLLRQVQNQEEQEKFFHQHGFLPKIVECGKCKDNLSQVYPLNNPAAKFKYFKCFCSPREKIPVTKEHPALPVQAEPVPVPGCSVRLLLQVEIF